MFKESLYIKQACAPARLNFKPVFFGGGGFALIVDNNGFKVMRGALKVVLYKLNKMIEAEKAKEVFLLPIPFSGFYECVLKPSDHKGNLYTVGSMYSLSEVCKLSNFDDFILCNESELLDHVNKYNDKYRTKAEKITANRWHDMLEVLPPCKWHMIGSWDVFHVSERYTANIVTWYAKSGDQCFEFMQDATISDSEIMALIKEGIENA